MTQSDLDALFAEHGSWEDAAAALELALEPLAEDDEARAPLLAQLGRIAAEHLGDAGRGRTLLEAAVDLDITHVDAVDRLADLYLQQNASTERSALLLDAIEASEDAGQQSRWFATLVHHYARVDSDPERALLVLQGALERLPGRSAIIKAAAELAHLVNLRDEVVELLTRSLAHTAETLGPARTAVLHRELGLLLASGEPDADRAIMHLEQAAEALPDDPDVRARLDEMLRLTGDWDAMLAQLTRDLDDTTGGPLRDAILDRIESVHRDEREDLRAAAQTRIQRISEGHDDDASWRTLGGYFEALEDWSGVLTTLESRLEIALDAELRDTIRRSIAHLLETHLDDAAEALVLWQELYEAHPEDIEAESRVHAAARAAGDWATLARIAAARFERSVSGPDRAAYLGERALAERELGLAAESLDHLRAACELDPTSDTLRDAYFVALAEADAHGELTDALEARGRDATAPEDARVDAWRQAASLAADTLEDLPRAIHALQELVSLRGSDAPALTRLAELLQREGRTQEAAATLSSLAAASEGDARVQAMVAEAAVLEADGGPAWELALHRVLEASPHHIATLRALAGAQEARDAWEEALDTWHRLLEVVVDAGPRADVLTRMGRIELAELGRAEAAVVTLEEAATLVPGHPIASLLLVEHWVSVSRWEKVLPLVEPLVATPDAFDEDERQGLLRHLAHAAASLSLPEKAVGAWESLLVLAPDDREAQHALPKMLAQAGRPEDAVRTATAILDSEGLLLDEAEERALLDVIAPLHHAAGRTEEARRCYQRLRQLDPWHADALRYLAHEGGDESSSTERIEASERLLAMTDDPLERFRLFVEIGDARAEDDDEIGAIAAYRDAIAIDPNSRAVLAKLLDLFTRTEQWRRAAEVLGKLWELESNPERRIRFLFTLAALFRDEMQNVAEAATYFEKILEMDRTRTEAFDALQTMLADAGEWGLLEQAYRRMLARTDESETSVRYRLFLAVGRVYEKHLLRLDEAIAAYRAASILQPSDPEPLIRIAGIVPPEGKPDGVLIEEHRAILALVPDRAPSYHALFGAYERRREFDAAWRLSAALRVLGLADARERAFFDELRPSTMPMARRPFEREDWSLIQHPTMDFLLTRLFDALGRSALSTFAVDPAQMGLGENDLLDLEADHPVTNLVRYLAMVLGIGAVDCYYLERGRGVSPANFARPSLLLGADVAGVAPGRREAFRIARAMLGLRPELRLAAMTRTGDGMKAWVYGTLAAWTQQVVPDPSEEAVRGIAERIQKLDAASLETIGVAVNGLFASAHAIDVSTWMRGAEYTANRVGLLLCGDLERAIEGIREEGDPLGKVTEAERIRDVLVYSMTDAYGELRGRLRIALGQ